MERVRSGRLGASVSPRIHQCIESRTVEVARLHGRGRKASRRPRVTDVANEMKLFTSALGVLTASSASRKSDDVDGTVRHPALPLDILLLPLLSHPTCAGCRTEADSDEEASLVLLTSFTGCQATIAGIPRRQDVAGQQRRPRNVIRRYNCRRLSHALDYFFIRHFLGSGSTTTLLIHF